MNNTTRRFPRSLSEAFPDVRARCGDIEVQRALLNLHRVTVMPKSLTPLRRPHVIPTQSGLLAQLVRFWAWLTR